MADTTQIVSPHMGRHYYASIVTLAENVPIDVISKMLGHTNITQTLIEMSEEERGKPKARCEAIRSIETYKGSNMCQMHLRDYLHFLSKEDIAFADVASV